MVFLLYSFPYFLSANRYKLAGHINCKKDSEKAAINSKTTPKSLIKIPPNTQAKYMIVVTE